jgi:hypothetical protein
MERIYVNIELVNYIEKKSLRRDWFSDKGKGVQCLFTQSITDDGSGGTCPYVLDTFSKPDDGCKKFLII